MTIFTTNTNQDKLITPQSHYVAFTGEYDQLKSMGFEFQKLYANNYQQWNLEDLRVWKKGAELTFDRDPNRFAMILDFLMTVGFENIPYQDSTIFDDYSYCKLYMNTITHECTTDEEPHFQEMKRIAQAMKNNEENIPDTPWASIALVKGDKSLEMLRELCERKWINIKERD